MSHRKRILLTLLALALVALPPVAFAGDLGKDGCTPGFWKNHPEAWATTGFTTTTTLGQVFGAAAAPYENVTLLAALSFGGGSDVNGAKRILLRAAVASLLNASSTAVDFPIDQSLVISSTMNALLTNDRATILALASQLDALNNLGCPL